MRRLLLALACLACALPQAAEAAPPSPNANIGVLRGTATYSNERPSMPGFVYRDLTFTGTLTAVGTRGVPQTYGCTLSGTVEGGASDLGNRRVSTAEGGWLTGSCGRFSAATCYLIRPYYEPSTLTCSQDFEGLSGEGMVTPPLEPQYAPVVDWTFAIADATNTCANLGCA